MGGTPPFVVRKDQDRLDNPVRFLNGRMDTKVSASDTAGAICVIDTVRLRRGGPPLHYHYEQDELFLVLEGQFRFQIGDAHYEAGPGDVVFGPRRVPHAFLNLSDTGRLMITFQPAGTMEQFFSSGLLDTTT